ncbi:MAG: 4Fe-4S dicluster domain-containing protein [Coriobacteriia bacterium]|nr:4Fe-4S dicluster domain-containing protein [Coriobacteriia bacterium]
MAMEDLSRRNFLKGAGVAAGAAASGAALMSLTGCEVTEEGSKYPLVFPESEGYLLVDHIKCCGCLTCMLACSMAHYGVADLSLSRIQIVQSSFDVFPNDIRQYQCRQCEFPVCVMACPSGACHIDEEHGNVRVIDDELCTGCGTCIQACPQQPHRTVWNSKTEKSSKCDLCINTPYLEAEGGPGGTQACVATCPMYAIVFTDEMPDQRGDAGYDLNLRTENAESRDIVEDPEFVDEDYPF